MGHRRYIEVEDRNPFGEEFDEQILQGNGTDSTFIEGYSDVRRDRELAVRKGEKVPPLKHRFQWARAKSADFQRADGKRVMHWQVNKHYQPIRYEDALKMGYNLKSNPAITQGEDGLAYHGDQVLMYCDARVAASNLKKVQQDTAFALEAPKRRMEKAVAEFNAKNVGAKAEAFSFLEARDGTEIEE